DRMRDAGVAEVEVDAYMFRALEHTRTGIIELEWLPEVRNAIISAVEEAFGPELGGGVFVRSDTNVEDLPQFSGAGLNLTVPHRTSMEEILTAVRQVWTSPFSERAYLWRKEILAEQGQVYPSVLLLASVPSEKSGVLITTGLEAGGADALTVVTAEGVGGGVDGEEAETILVLPDGSARLLTQAKAPRRRALSNREGGGVEWLVSAMPDTLLRPEELAQLREAAERWETRFAPGEADAVWDMEFGFVEGKLWLFQVRPFIRARNAGLLERLRVLDEEVLRRGSTPVSLLKPI
ncbi:MAG: PEP/pyruvate-binding domain-containing protein, partial [Longimicrobiales bacterium]|nr:PEP/pyruvate-binding domain-containing protein [Longimicrobiales bacterium]